MKKLLIVFVTLVFVLTACQGLRPSQQEPPVKGDPGVSTQRFAAAEYSPVLNPQDRTGAFRTNCRFSHVNYSDPILFPGQPLASHLHAFFGNTGTNYQSNAQSIANTGNSTCAGGTANRTAYWVPALIDTGGNRWEQCTGAEPAAGCKTVYPGANPAEKPAPGVCASSYWSNRWCLDTDHAMQIYYKSGYRGVDARTVHNFPAGLRMIVGDSKSTTAQNLDTVWWGCKPNSHGDGITHKSATIVGTNCRPGQLLVQLAEFPQCWDGVNLDSPDHKSHMSYALGWPDRGCPATHPVPLAAITQHVYYRIPQGANIANWRLASDMYDGPAGYSNHADWWNGWDRDVFQLIVDNCYQPRLDCQMDLLGDGRKLNELPGG